MTTRSAANCREAAVYQTVFKVGNVRRPTFMVGMLRVRVASTRQKKTADSEGLTVSGHIP